MPSRPIQSRRDTELRKYEEVQLELSRQTDRGLAIVGGAIVQGR